VSTPESPAPAPADVPVCPRHPDRESWVRCQRCERPVCPACQRPAAVGVQCVDCVAEGARTVRTPRTTLGGAVRSRETLVTKVIIGLCVALYAAGFVLPPELSAYLPLVNAESYYTTSFAAGNYWQPLTSAFLHASPLHLLFNMYALWVTGQYLEPLLGRARFLALYLVSALGGAVGATLLPMTAGVTTVGASGAVFGLFGALFVVNRRLGRQSNQVLVLIGINLALGFFVPNISWQGHVGGLVTGAVVAALLSRRRGPGAAAAQWTAVGAVAVVVLGLLAFAAARMTVGA
jgi:membrane associated rhomboid family serine protease